MLKCLGIQRRVIIVISSVEIEGFPAEAFVLPSEGWMRIGQMEKLEVGVLGRRAKAQIKEKNTVTFSLYRLERQD